LVSSGSLPFWLLQLCLFCLLVPQRSWLPADVTSFFFNLWPRSRHVSLSYPPFGIDFFPSSSFSSSLAPVSIQLASPSTRLRAEKGKVLLGLFPTSINRALMLRLELPFLLPTFLFLPVADGPFGISSPVSAQLESFSLLKSYLQKSRRPPFPVGQGHLPLAFPPKIMKFSCPFCLGYSLLLFPPIFFFQTAVFLQPLRVFR